MLKAGGSARPDHSRSPPPAVAGGSRRDSGDVRSPLLGRTQTRSCIDIKKMSVDLTRLVPYDLWDESEVETTGTLRTRSNTLIGTISLLK